MIPAASSTTTTTTTTTVAPTTTTIAGLKLASTPPASGVGSIAHRITLPTGDAGRCLASASDGTIWTLATTPTGYGLVEIAPTGKRSTFNLKAQAPTTATSCLVLDTQGDLWFADTVAHHADGTTYTAMVRFDPTSRRFSYLPTPTGATFPSAGPGGVWFVESALNKIAVMSPSGQIRAFALPAGDAVPSAFAVFGTHLWVATSNSVSDVVLELDSNGHVLATATLAPSGIDAMALSPSGRLFVGANNGVDELLANGHWIVVFGTSIGPQSMIFGPDGHLWYVSAWFGCLYSLYGTDVPGRPAPAERLPGCAEWITAGPAGTVVVSADSGYLYEVRTAASSTSSSSSPAATAPTSVTRIETPARIFSSPIHTIVNAGITLGLILFITFPAQLFNQTFKENYEELRRRWERRVKPLKSAREHLARRTGERGALIVFSVVVIIGAFLDTLLDPKFGGAASWIASFVATILAVLTGIAVPAWVTHTYRTRRHRDTHRRLHALPAGLAVAALCVFISRVTDFQPGYFYGLICGVAFTSKLAKREQGHVVALTTLATILVAIAAWFAWVPIAEAIHGSHPFIGLVALDDFLASVFNGGLVGAVFSLLPLSFLPGIDLYEWHKLAWAATFGVACFGLVQVMLRPVTGVTHPGSAPVVTVVVLFVAFGAGSIWFRYHFTHRKPSESHEPPEAAASSLTPATGTGGTASDGEPS